MGKALDVTKYIPLLQNQGKATLFFRGKGPVTFRLPAAPMQGGRLALVPIIPTGEFYRQDLGYFVITKTDLFNIAKLARERSDLLQIDYQHAAFDKEAGATEKRAAGWIDRRSLFIAPWGRGYILMGWAYVTPEAAIKRSKGEMLYISPGIINGRREIGRPGAPAGVQVGWSLVNVALVDIPFFDMPPVALFSKTGQHYRRTLTFGALAMDEQLKTALAQFLATLGVPADLIPSGVDGIMQLYMQASAAAPAQAPAAAAPAAMAAAPVAAPVAAPAAAGFNMFGFGTPALQLPPVYRVPQQAPALFGQMFGQQAGAPQVQRPQQVQANPADPNLVALFGMVGNLATQVQALTSFAQQSQQANQAAQYQAAEVNGQNAMLAFAGLNPAQLAQQAPGFYQQATNQASPFVGPNAFSPLPRPVVPALFGGLNGLAQGREDKGKQLFNKVQGYQKAQSASGRNIDYSTAMSEARSYGLLAGLE